MTMLEKMARAICKAERFDPDARAYPGAPAAWERYSNRCLAALDAIREPGDALAEVGAEAADDDMDISPQLPSQVANAWTAMIDAIREGRA